MTIIQESKYLSKNSIKDEFLSMELGDARLNKRFFKVVESLSNSSTMPINQACGDVAATKAAYRLFDNDKLTPSHILSAHQMQTQKRMQLYPVVLAIQDTTYLDYTNHLSKEGIGPIGTSKQNLNGFVMHGTLITTSNGLPLGRLTHQIWARDKDDRRKPSERERLKIADKESKKWLETLNELVDLTPNNVETITICDRESDIYDFFVEAEKLNTYLLVRSAQNRRLAGEDEKLWNYMEQCPLKRKIKLAVPAKGKMRARITKVEIRYSLVEIMQPNRNSTSEEDCVNLTAVMVKEIDPPLGTKGIRWMLLTNLPVTNTDEAIQCINWYKLRWRIEEYHKILKSGCRVEDCRLETNERIIRYLALMSVIAWRLFWVSHISRTDRNIPCTVALTESEWKVLYCKIHKTKKLPDEIPNIYDAVRWIARLGGFLGRRGDGEPGITTVWRGWQRLTDLAETWSILNAP